MAIGNIFASISGFLKDVYADRLIDVSYRNAPLYSLIPKIGNPEAGGDAFIYAMKHSRGQSRSGTYSNAVTASGRTFEQAVQFVITRVQNTDIASFDTQALLSSAGKVEAFADILTEGMDGAVTNISNDINLSLYSDGTGSRGQVGSIGSTSITLLYPDQALNFSPGMELSASQTAAGSSRAQGTGAHGLYVGSVDSIGGVLGIVTASGTPVSPQDSVDGAPNLAANDFLQVLGDGANGGANLKPVGLAGWIPFGGVTSTTFFGVNRAVNAQRLGGSWLDATNLQPEEALIESAKLIARQNGRASHVMVPPNFYARLLKSQNAKVVVVDEVTPTVSFEGLKLSTPAGLVKIIMDNAVPPNRFHMINVDDMAYRHLSPGSDPIFIWELDGNKSLRTSGNDDGLSIKVQSWGSLTISRPYNFCTTQIAA